MGPDVRTLVAGPIAETAGGSALYRVAPQVVVRTPLLPVSALARARDPLPALEDPDVVRALAIGSPTLLDKALRSETDPKERARTRASLARYLIRMSTRPTPYGGFAAVSVTEWADRTELRLGSTRTRTRPDMGWLRGLLADRERRPEVRAGLRWRAHPLIALIGDRLIVPEGGSVLATEPARMAMTAASDWIGHAELSEAVRAATGGSPDQVGALIDQLAGAGLLTSDLAPAVTGAAACSGADAFALARRADATLAEPLRALEEAIVAADAGDPPAAAFGRVRERARATFEHPETFQTDLARGLAAEGLAATVGDECAWAVEVLLRLGPGPGTNGDLAGYTRRFAGRWGVGDEVPLSEVFDPLRGLGPLPHTHGSASVVDPAAQARRAERLSALALESLHDDRRVVQLDPDTIAALSTWPARGGARALSAGSADAPLSLDVSAFLLASDSAAVDAGDFTLVIGPNLGAPVAGRWLGRFADLCGSVGADYFAWLLQAEAQADPGQVAAEVVYLPATARSTNVVVRPTVSRHEVVVSGRGSAEHQLDLDDLLVGHDGTRLYLRSRSLGVRIRPTARHMLNHHGAPAVCQFLDAVGQGPTAELTAFDWGASESLPVLPRVQVGRTVLAPARWLVTVPGWTSTGGVERSALDAALQRASDRWGLPGRVYATVADNRLLLDLTEPDDREQLRREFKTSGGSMRLQEALPDVGDAWLPGPGGGYLTELVISLVRRPSAARPAHGPDDEHTSSEGPRVNGVAVSAGEAASAVRLPAPVAVRERLRLPGSDWLFAKFYAPYDQLTRVLVTDLADLIEMAENSGLARRWFFLRYSDPEPHLRVRWQGEPDLLLRHLLPQVTDFAAQLVGAGRVNSLVIDSYDRELDRYGGPSGLEVCEDLFHADSSAVRSLLSLTGVDLTDVTVASTVQLLSGLGLTAAERVAFYQSQTALTEDPGVGRAAGDDYRARKTRLRSLAEPDGVPGPLGASLAALRTAVQSAGATLRRAESEGLLTSSVAKILPSLVHMHHNRMVGLGQPSEPHLLELLVRTERGLLQSGASTSAAAQGSSL